MLRGIVRRICERLTDDELRDLELEENDNRKGLLAGERRKTFASSKRLLEHAKKAAEVLRATRKTPNPKGGRPTRAGAPQEEIAEALGADRRTIERAEQHVATAEAFPWLQGDDWRQADVERFRKQFTPSERAAIGKAIEEELGDRKGANLTTDSRNCGYLAEGKTADIAARRAGFKSADTMQRAQFVAEKGAPELQAATGAMRGRSSCRRISRAAI